MLAHPAPCLRRRTSIHNGSRRTLQVSLYCFMAPKTSGGETVLVCVVLVCGAVYGLFSVHGAFLLPCGAARGPVVGVPGRKSRRSTQNADEEDTDDEKIFSCTAGAVHGGLYHGIFQRHRHGGGRNLYRKRHLVHHGSVHHGYDPPRGDRDLYLEDTG